MGKIVGTLSEVEAYVRDHNPGSIVGVDEAGRGTWAGPIIAAAAAVSVRWQPPPGLTDSKKMSQEKRAAIVEQYSNDDAVVIGIGIVNADEIDQIGIDAAQAKAQAEAIRSTFWRLVYPPFVVVDGVQLPAIQPSEVQHLICVPRADLLVPAVSLASVFAKVTQVARMIDFEKQYPGYGFQAHCGYGTSMHQEALERLGPCKIHRKSFKPVARMVKSIPGETWMLLD